MEIIGAAALVAGALVAVAWLLVRNGGLSGGSATTAQRDEQGRLLGERQADLARLEERLNARASELDRRESEQNRREDVLDGQRDKLLEREGETAQALERACGMSAAQARKTLLDEVQEQAHQDRARLLRQIEEETKRTAERKVRNILSVAMQRLAASHAAETTVSVVQLPSDDMKG
ncbi:MAG: DUF3552 domain-containing protein, partial [Solirubrobacterales bacterium]|nr:DUF3552 domain-containing protein [Solirubrobacterales bacterium]